MKKIFFALVAFCLMSTSCNDFVDVVPKGNTIPSTVEDLARMMNTLFTNVPPYFSDISANSWTSNVMLSDDYTITQDPDQNNYSLNFNTMVATVMTWSDSEDASDMTWNAFYKSNYVVNYVLDNIDIVEESRSYDRGEVKGYALVNRALNYYVLVNLWGKQYDASAGSTSDTDLGVPLVLEADVNKQHPRATVATVYGQILTDLEEAISLIKTEVSEYSNIPSLSAAYALRARVRLQMQDYDGAYSDAAKALELNDGIIDYNTCSQVLPEYGPMGGIARYPTPLVVNSEVILARYQTESLPMIPTQRYLSIIDTENDLRYTLFAYFIDGELQMFYRYHTHSGINVGEVWLIKAEAALRKTSPDFTEAYNALEYLRERRYKESTYQPTGINDAAELLAEVLRERRREIRLTEMGFFDLKRLNLDLATAHSLTRTYLGEEYTLPVGDPRWQLAIPRDVMQLNSQMVQNER